MAKSSGRAGLLSSVASLALLPLAVGAQPADDGERGSVLFGAFITDRDTSTRLDTDAGPGTEIDLEDDLGLETSMSVLRLGGYLWLGRRHRVDAAFFDLSRDATTPIHETIHSETAAPGLAGRANLEAGSGLLARRPLQQRA